jgi:hypothetical protein
MRGRKALVIVIKVLIGVGCLYLIWSRISDDLTPERMHILRMASGSRTGVLSAILCILLIPVNWGIEARKWQLITAPVEPVTYWRATKSVYSGVCAGNLAPSSLARSFSFHLSTGRRSLYCTLSAACSSFPLPSLPGFPRWSTWPDISQGAMCGCRGCPEP